MPYFMRTDFILLYGLNNYNDLLLCDLKEIFRKKNLKVNIN